MFDLSLRQPLPLLLANVFQFLYLVSKLIIICIENCILFLTAIQGGSGGKWQTPHQQAKLASIRGRGIIEPGDVGIWATCARGQEGKATVELRSLLHKVCLAPKNWITVTDFAISLPSNSMALLVKQKKRTMKMKMKMILTSSLPFEKRPQPLKTRKRNLNFSPRPVLTSSVSCSSRSAHP